LNKLLDAARETTADAIMITSLLDLVDAVHSAAEYVPPYPGKPFGDPDDAGGYGGGSGDPMKPELPTFGAIGLSGNSSAINGTDV
jgi:hypothetical protein